MVKKTFTIFCSLALLLSLTLSAAIPSHVLSKRMLSDLDFIGQVFEVKYAPKPWKERRFGWNLEHELERARAKLLSLPSPTVKDFHLILKEFFNSMRDYHVGIHFYSTEQAFLPFYIKGAWDGESRRYFIVQFDDEDLPDNFPLLLGDEIISFDGKTIDAVVRELMEEEFPGNTPTDWALAELALTQRQARFGAFVPKGGVSLTVCREGTLHHHSLQWDYTPEQIRDAAKLGLPAVGTALPSLQGKMKKSLKQTGLLNKLMVWSRFDKTPAKAMTNPYLIGARKSFVPALGRKLWISDEESTFDAYICSVDGIGRVGCLRIPHYMGDEVEADEFEEIIKLFERSTDALVIDQVNNPGGSVFYLYALASMLTDQPLKTPKHHLTLTQQEVYIAQLILSMMDDAKDLEEAHEFFGETFGGYLVDSDFLDTMRQFCDFVIENWESGNIYTKPIHIFGVDEIKPHLRVQYTKPILLLTNALDFSGGDFFPAILQDNARVTILGTQTAGAGGYVLSTEFPNSSGIEGFRLTASLAKRPNQEPLENLGVIPDIVYELTPEDIQHNYQGYLHAIRNALEKIATAS